MANPTVAFGVTPEAEESIGIGERDNEIRQWVLLDIIAESATFLRFSPNYELSENGGRRECIGRKHDAVGVKSLL